MQDKTILITGGAAGIGAGIARRLIKAGARVVIADRNAANIPNARCVICDVASEEEVASLIDSIRNIEGRLDGLVCNAGFMIRKPIAELTLAEWSSVLAKAGETILRAAKGSIITIASTRAHMSEPNTESYAASKGGILALSHALAISLGPDVRVNIISPGWIDTQGAELRDEDHAQHPAGRVGTVDDIAALAAFLLGPDAGFITGSEFIVDGGMTRKMIYAE
jgi:NAD(P)-dependent dehydrogenase (short-subunit alcohol dehydrogenase family)